MKVPEHLGDLPTPSGVSRRAFLRALVAAPAFGASVLVVDWEKLLWTPKPIVVVPAMPNVWLKDIDLETAQAQSMLFLATSEGLYRFDGMKETLVSKFAGGMVLQEN